MDKELEKEVNELSIPFATAIAQALSQRGKPTKVSAIMLALNEVENNILL